MAELSEKLDTKVSVESVYFQLFNSFALEKLYVEDLRGDTLAFVEKIDLKFQFFSIFKDVIVFNSINFNNFYGNLKTDTAGTNVDFIIKAFSKPQKNTKSSSVAFDIQKIRLENSAFSFTNLGKTALENPQQFDANRMNFSDINTELTFQFFRNDSIFLQINHFSAKEKSGLQLNNLTSKIEILSREIRSKEIKIILPHSQTILTNLSLQYDSIQALNNFSENASLNVSLQKTTLSLTDLAPLLPDVRNLKGNVTLSATLSGKVSNLRLQNINFAYGKRTSLLATLEMSGLPNINETFIYGDIAHFSTNIVDIQDVIANLTHKPVKLPEKIGNISYKGKISGFFSNLVAYGQLKSAAGDISTDLSLQFSNNMNDFAYSGRVKSNNLRLDLLTDNQMFGNAAFDIATKGKNLQKSGLKGTVDAKVAELQFNNYLYKDLILKGNYSTSGFEGNIALNDENIAGNFNGKIDFSQKIPLFNFLIDIKDADLYALHLYEKHPNTTITFSAKTNLTGNSLDNINGFVKISDVEFISQGTMLLIDSIVAKSVIEDGHTTFSIVSKYLNGSLEGQFLYSHIEHTLQKIVSASLPALVKNIDEKTANVSDCEMGIDLTISHLDEITDALSLPFSVAGENTISGTIDEKAGKIDLQMNIASLATNNGLSIENLTLKLHNQQSKLQLDTRSTFRNTATKTPVSMSFFVNASAENDNLTTRFGWQNAKAVTNAGEVILNTKFARENNHHTAHIDVLPAQVIVADTVWQIYRGAIDWKSDTSLIVDNIELSGNNQFLQIGGVASKRESDFLTVSLGNLNIDFIIKLVGLQDLDFGGNATGIVKLSSLFSKPIYYADITVENTTMNEMPVGTAYLHSTWNEQAEAIGFTGTFIEKNDTIIVTQGLYTPKSDSLDIFFDTRGVSVSFLSRYFEEVISDFNGKAYGNLRLFGATQDETLGFEGDILVRNGQARVILLNTTYYFDNEFVHFRPQALSLKNLKLQDTEHHQATATGVLNHSGMFQNMKYDFNIQTKNLMGLNTQAEDNEYFYGKAYLDGTVHIFGDMARLNIDVNGISKPHTQVNIKMKSTTLAADNSFIRFVDKTQKKPSVTEKKPDKKQAVQTDVNVTLQIEATPDAEVDLLIAPQSGDMINAQGSGNLRLEYNAKSNNIKLFGTYTIQQGYYLFSLWNTLLRQFKIDHGSTISWAGNLQNANIDIRGIYATNASIRDLLDKSLSSDMQMSSVNMPVNCVLKLTDNLLQPHIEFGIEMPTATENVRQVVRSVINTTELMNQQIFSLLLFNKFYRPDYLNTNAANSGNSEAISLVTATMNGWLAQMIKSKSWQIGVVLRPDQEKSLYQSTIAYQPNNRLRINGNVGYQTDDIYKEGNRVIADLDLEYELTESGKLLFKAYNHTVDRQSVSKYSQGAGLMYREEFSSVSDMLHYYWRVLTGKNKK